MKDKHYKEKLSAFLNHELPTEKHKLVGEHLLHCKDCRTAHDEIKFGMEVAKNLESAPAPKNVWNKIEAKLDKDSLNQKAAFAFFNWQKATFASVLLVTVLGLTTIIYLNLFQTNPAEIVESKPETSTQIKNSSAWEVETISGKPKIENSLNESNLKVGGIVETDENSRAKIDVADIGQVEVAPNSIVKLVNSSEKEHRLSLKRGSLQARIIAPPRLFVVDTPSAVAVDLGCAYKLEVDEAGNSKLHVTSGYVALEREGRESIVPAGAFCYTKRGKGLGTPYFETASTDFKNALKEFDFENGGNSSLQKILKLAEAKDTLTLWHLLSRVSPNEREKVLDKIISYMKLPPETTREGILRLDKNMLEKLKNELEMLWY